MCYLLPQKKDITSNELRSNRLHIVYFGNTNCKLKTFKFHSCVVLEFGHFIYSYLLFHFENSYVQCSSRYNNYREVEKINGNVKYL